MDKKSILKVIILFGAICILLLRIDYLNLFSKWGIHIDELNTEFWNIFLNCSVVVILYIITYLVLDKENVKKEKNKRATAVILLSETYQKCLEDIHWMDQEDYRVSVANKTNYDDYLDSQPAFKRIINNLFDIHEVIIDFAKEGIVTSGEMKDYLEVKKKVRLFFVASITFFDKYDLIEKQRKEVEQLLNSVLEKISKA